MFKHLSTLALAVVMSCGLQEQPAPTQPGTPETPPVVEDPKPVDPVVPGLPEIPALPDREPELFGAPLSKAGEVEVVDFDALMGNPTLYAGKVIQVRGVVRASCQVRGCWMEVRSVRFVESNGLTVRFKDYGFFVPLDSRSSDTRIEGSLRSQTLTPAQVAEYEAEGYSFDFKLDDGSAVITEFTASGVEMWRKQ